MAMRPSTRTGNAAGQRPLLPAIDLCGIRGTRLICGGNPFSGFSHVNKQLDREMIEYYTMPRLQETLAECLRCGIGASA